ncbi:UvrD-like helicase, ATP-binding domain, P-loop containing nucleoside triphosphate hydrolase [Tanacetum coccineum]
MKFYSLSRGVVIHLLSGKEVDLPMQVTDEQMDIISSRTSSFITGRSGTGKTIVLTTKLFQHEHKFRITSNGIYEGESSQFRGSKVNDYQDSKKGVLRQLFVTVSPHLCYAVKQNVSHLTSISSNGNSLADVNLDDTNVITSELNDIPDTLASIPIQSYPLVITFQKFLMMLDGTLGNSFYNRFLEARESGHGNIISSRSIALQTFMRSREVTRSSTLTKEKREIVYTLFQAYEKMKTKCGDFDLGDFVNDIHQRLKKGNYEGDQMDFVYIDEVQDLSMRQISLFKYISQNANEGFIFAGDTAQTIARGIDFRFQEIRHQFYKEFLSTRPSGKQERGLLSGIFQLKQNFKTHAGVLDLAQSVIDILYCYFVHSIDNLEPETSLISGEAPVLLESKKDENAIVTIFGGSESSGEALVLTILECKGLEFHDVLLYNFFGTFPLKDQWRVIYGYMKKYDWLDEKLPQSFPAFTKARHEELSKPMLDYWKMRGLVQTRKLDDSVAQAMRVVSSPQEWRKRAGDTIWEKLAKASGLRASADQMRGTNHEAFTSYVREAAGIFESIGKLESVASCYCDLGEYEHYYKISLR